VNITRKIRSLGKHQENNIEMLNVHIQIKKLLSMLGLEMYDKRILQITLLD
jgi:hypothetical protein